MKVIWILFTLAFTLNSYSTEAFSEDHVQGFLSAEKVIEISGFTARHIRKTCEDRTAIYPYDRAFVVKRQDEVYLYITKGELADLKKCREL